jgi:hypothetical protein
VVEFTSYRTRPDDPKLPVLDLFAGRKWAPILRFAQGRPFAWVDDVIPERLVRRARWRRDRLLLPVDPAHGLRREHVDRLVERPPAPRRHHRLRPSARRRPGSDGPSVLNVGDAGATLRDTAEAPEPQRPA